MAPLVEIALEDVFGVGRHADVVGDAFHHRQRRVAQASRRCRAHRPATASRRRHDRSDARRPRSSPAWACPPRHWPRRSPCRSLGATRSTPVSCCERSISRRRPTLVQPVLGSIDIVDRGGDIRPAVGAVLQMHRQLGDVGVVAGQHHRLAGRLGARHLENLGLVAEPPLDFLQQLVRLDAERRGEPAAAAHDVADQFRLLRARRRGTAPPSGCPPSPRQCRRDRPARCGCRVRRCRPGSR